MQQMRHKLFSTLVLLILPNAFNHFTAYATCVPAVPQVSCSGIYRTAWDAMGGLQVKNESPNGVNLVCLVLGRPIVGMNDSGRPDETGDCMSTPAYIASGQTYKFGDNSPTSDDNFFNNSIRCTQKGPPATPVGTATINGKNVVKRNLMLSCTNPLTGATMNKRLFVTVPNGAAWKVDAVDLDNNASGSGAEWKCDDDWTK